MGLAVSKDYLRGYADGLADAEASAAYAERLRVFAAIRRAAELAREMEASALIAPDPYDQELWAKARGVRLAIRVAIGSEKA